MDSNENLDDIVYEEDKGADLVKKLRTKLKKCEQEKKEYLDGWQRQKADALNAKKHYAATLAEAKSRAVADLLQGLLPALDSFDIAMRGKAWRNVDEDWRTGVEQVYSQLLASLEDYGVHVYGEAGSTFDPKEHEAVGYEKGGKESGTIARVERRGYKIGDTIIRAAQVIVYS
tara:strand:- start:7761 stop:8279 length:519 start_codon:yes stop_codon:yes gene_type:complete